MRIKGLYSWPEPYVQIVYDCVLVTVNPCLVHWRWKKWCDIVSVRQWSVHGPGPGLSPTSTWTKGCRSAKRSQAKTIALLVLDMHHKLQLPNGQYNRPRKSFPLYSNVWPIWPVKNCIIMPYETKILSLCNSKFGRIIISGFLFFPPFFHFDWYKFCQTYVLIRV